MTRDLRSLDFLLLRGVCFLLVSLMWHLNDRSLGFQWQRNADRPAIAEIGLSSITYSDYYSRTTRRSIISLGVNFVRKTLMLTFNDNFLLRLIISCKEKSIWIFSNRSKNQNLTSDLFSARHQIEYSFQQCNPHLLSIFINSLIFNLIVINCCYIIYW